MLLDINCIQFDTQNPTDIQKNIYNTVNDYLNKITFGKILIIKHRLPGQNVIRDLHQIIFLDNNLMNVIYHTNLNKGMGTENLLEVRPEDFNFELIDIDNAADDD